MFKRLRRLFTRKKKPSVTLEDMLFIQSQVHDPTTRMALGVLIKEELRKNEKKT